MGGMGLGGGGESSECEGEGLEDAPESPGAAVKRKAKKDGKRVPKDYHTMGSA